MQFIHLSCTGAFFSRSMEHFPCFCCYTLTSSLIEDIQAIPSKGGQDFDGRLWDVLYMAHFAAKRAGSENIIFFNLIMQVGRKKNYTVKMIIGPGDNLEPVITLMRPNED